MNLEMTPQMAMYTLDSFNLRSNADKYDDQALDVAIEALKKQIPKKPITWENKYYFSPSPNDDWGYECPCCGNRDIDYPEHHCICGQALDWEDEENDRI